MRQTVNWGSAVLLFVSDFYEWREGRNKLLDVVIFRSVCCANITCWNAEEKYLSCVCNSSWPPAPLLPSPLPHHLSPESPLFCSCAQNRPCISLPATRILSQNIWLSTVSPSLFHYLYHVPYTKSCYLVLKTPVQFNSHQSSQFVSFSIT